MNVIKGTKILILLQALTAPLPAMSEQDKEDARKVYAMVTNIDDNVKKVLDKLEELGIADNTIVIFMSDNGPQQTRYNANMRGLKSSVIPGRCTCSFLFCGIRRWSTEGRAVETAAAHLDVLPTLSELCQSLLPKDTEPSMAKAWYPCSQGQTAALGRSAPCSSPGRESTQSATRM